MDGSKTVSFQAGPLYFIKEITAVAQWANLALKVKFLMKTASFLVQIKLIHFQDTYHNFFSDDIPL